MDETAIIHADLVGVIWTIAAGFVAVVTTVVGTAFWLGKKVAGYSQLQGKVEDLEQGLKDHDSDCKEDKKQRDTWQHGVEERLSKGSTDLAVLKTGQEHTNDALKRIEAKLDTVRAA